MQTLMLQNNAVHLKPNYLHVTMCCNRRHTLRSQRQETANLARQSMHRLWPDQAAIERIIPRALRAPNFPRRLIGN